MALQYNTEPLAYRVMEVLNFQIQDRCAELTNIFDQCSLRELQGIFPIVIHSIFGCEGGGLGWGLRTTTKENSPFCFPAILPFFGTNGPMLRLCYRLLNESVKFEFNIEMLPHKIISMIQSGQYSMFYTDLLNVDPFRRQVTSLSLNAFDYYILHFAIHGTYPLHRMYPAALQVHNERLKSLYFYLAVEYVTTFLPTHPDAVILPVNICQTVKAPQPMPVQPLQLPKRVPKYLKIPNVNLYGNSSPGAQIQQQVRTVESPRVHAWRSESMLYFFVDVWLRFDIDGARDLPSSEFVRVVRILIKQLHFFGNSAPLDHTGMNALRKIAQPMVKARIYPFLRSLIDRWPLDSSMSIVLELWLSYIQPWCYTLDSEGNIKNYDIPIGSQFDNFIADNLVLYSQIFVMFLPRFERLDYSLEKNCVMLYRMVKVITQSTLPKKLYEIEKSYAGNSFGFDSPQKHSSYIRHHNISTAGGGCGNEWETVYSEEIYKPMFSDVTRAEIEHLIRTLHMARTCIQEDLNILRREIAKKARGLSFLRNIFEKLFSSTPPAMIKYDDMVKIPGILEAVITVLGTVFSVPIPNLSVDEVQSGDESANFSLYDNSDYMDMSKLSPAQILQNTSRATPGIDPAILPIQSNENSMLVRLFHWISNKINEKFGNEIQASWNCTDFRGKLARQVIFGPMTVKWFDNSGGIKQLFEDQLPPRICLRLFASYQVLSVIMVFLFFGYLIFSSSLLGLLFLIFLCFAYVVILALIT